MPEGWEFVTKVNSNGSVVKYYTNVLGQRFYSEEDLMRNIRDAKARGLSIYAPEFNASRFGASSSQHKKSKSKVGEASTRVSKKKKQNSDNRGVKTVAKEKEVVEQSEVQEVKTGSCISDQATGSSMFRASRRVAGLKPELNLDFDFGKPLEYIIKEKPQE